MLTYYTGGQGHWEAIWMSATPPTTKPTAFGRGPFRADLPRKYEIQIDGTLLVPFPADGIHSGAGFPRYTGVWHRGSCQP